MKKFFTLFFAISSFRLSAQVAVNTTNTAPHSSAIFDVSSTSKGLLIPRMTTLQRTAIASPAQGLLVYDTNTSSFWFYKVSAWTNLSPSGGGWLLTGNSLTNPAVNFLGTTDGQPLRLRLANI